MTAPIRFTDITAFLAEETAEPAESFATAFTETADQVRLARTDEAITADMPDPLQMQLGVEMLVTTLFDLLRDTRLDGIAERWSLTRLCNRRFLTLADRNAAIALLLVDLDDRPMPHVGKSRRAIFEEIERGALAALLATPFEICRVEKGVCSP